MAKQALGPPDGGRKKGAQFAMKNGRPHHSTGQLYTYTTNGVTGTEFLDFELEGKMFIEKIEIHETTKAFGFVKVSLMHEIKCKLAGTQMSFALDRRSLGPRSTS